MCETACLLGIIPAVLPYTETHHPQTTRLEAARFMHQLCTRSARTLQMFIACQGLPGLVRLLLGPFVSSAPELALLAIDAIKAVLDLKGACRNDLCRTFVALEAPGLLAHAMLEINRDHPAHAG